MNFFCHYFWFKFIFYVKIATPPPPLKRRGCTICYSSTFYSFLLPFFHFFFWRHISSSVKVFRQTHRFHFKMWMSWIAIYIKYPNLPRNVIIRLPYPWSRDTQGQAGNVLGPSADKETHRVLKPSSLSKAIRSGFTANLKIREISELSGNLKMGFF